MTTKEQQIETLKTMLANDQTKIGEDVTTDLMVRDLMVRDLMVRRADVHEKNEWMLRSSLS